MLGESALLARLLQPLSRQIRPRAALVVGEVGLPVLAGFRCATEMVQRFGRVQAGVGVVGVDVEGDVERIESRLPLAELSVDATELRPRFQVLMIQLHGDVVSLERGVRPVEAEQRFGQMEVGFGIRRLIHQTQPKRFDGGGRFPRVGQAAALDRKSVV